MCFNNSTSTDQTLSIEYTKTFQNVSKAFEKYQTSVRVCYMKQILCIQTHLIKD